MANQFNVDQLRLDIENLIREFPEIAEDEMLRADMLDGETDITGVLSSLFNTADDTKGEIKKLSDQIEQRTQRRARLAKQVDFLRGLMLKVLQSADLKKFRLPEATLSQRNAQPQIVGEVDVNVLPDDLCRITVEPDRAKIREALMNGQDVPGVYLSNAPPTLSINTK